MESYQTGRRSSVIPTPAILSRPRLIKPSSSMGEGIDEHPKDDSNLLPSGQGLKLQHQELRRNSISSLLGPFTRSRATGNTSARPSSASLHSQGSKYRSLKLYQYLAGYGSSSNGAQDSTELSALDETFKKVHSQLVSVVTSLRFMVYLYSLASQTC